MILFAHRAAHISVIRLKSVDDGVDNIGKLRLSGEWIWDTSKVDCFRTLAGYETLSGSEKRQIIGMIDALNGVVYRSMDNMRTQWLKIIGR